MRAPPRTVQYLATLLLSSLLVLSVLSWPMAFPVEAQEAIGPAIESSTLRPVKEVLPCREDDEVFCFRDHRFRVQIEWFLEGGESGSARRIFQDATSDDSGLFWFFQESNWEMLLKVLDGCGFNDRFWFFAAAASDVGYRISIVDTEAAVERTYTKPAGLVTPSLTDTFALPTCDPEQVPKVEMSLNAPFLYAGESATLTLQVYDEEGLPSPGRRVELTTDLGSIEPSEVTTDDQGAATAVFDTGPLGGREAVLRARLITSEDTASLDFLGVGVLARPAVLALQASPTTIIPFDTFISLQAIVLDFEGIPIGGWPVSFSADLGSFPDGDTRFTAANGVAQALLAVTEQELVGNPDSFEVMATVDGVDGPLVDTITIQVNRE